MSLKREEGCYTHHHQQCCCLLDLNYSSNLLASKIADIPHKLKYETIMTPIFEYCFGTSDQDKVWEQFKVHYQTNNSSPIIHLKIDWIRDETFIYSQIFNLVKENLDFLARKFGLWNNRKFILSTIYYNCWLRYKETIKLPNDRELVMVAVKENGCNLYSALGELKNDKEIVIQAVKQNGNAFQYASEELRNDKEILFLGLESYHQIFRVTSERLKNDRDVVFKAVSHGLSIRRASETFKNDRELLLMSAKIDGDETLRFACSELRNDKELVRQAIQQTYRAFEFASDELKNDGEFVKEIVMKHGECLRYASKDLKDDLEIVELALKSYPDAIHDISDRLRKDTEFISKLIGKRGFNHLPEEFSNDREIVLESIKLASRNLERASNELQNDREFILHVVKNWGMALGYVKEEFKSDREMVMKAVTQNGNALDYVDKQFYDDKEIILKAAEHRFDYAYFYYNLSDRLKKDRELLLKCATAIRSFPRKYHLDRDFMMETVKAKPKVVISIAYPLIVNDRTLAMRIVKQDGLLLGELPFKYRNDREIVSFAIQQNKEVFKYISDELKNDSQILEIFKTVNN